MTKQEAMDRLGCENLAELSRAINVTPSAISHWSDPLPPHAIRRIESVLYRKIGGRKHGQRR